MKIRLLFFASSSEKRLPRFYSGLSMELSEDAIQFVDGQNLAHARVDGPK